MKLLFTFVMCLCLSASGQFLTTVNVATILDTNCSHPVELSGSIVPYTPPPADAVPFTVVCYPTGVYQTNLIKLYGVYYYVAVPGNSVFGNPARIAVSCTNQSPLGTQPPDPQDNNNNNNNNNGNGGPPSPCSCGMPVYNVSEPYLSLWLRDEPLGYQPGLGPRLSLTLDYKQRETNSGYNPNWFSFGKKWNSGWLSYVSQVIDSGSGNSSNVVYYADGGSEEYHLNNVDLLTQTILTGSTNTGFTLTKPDGSMDIYDFIVNNTNGAFEEAFLSQRVNSQGQSFTLQYANYTPGPNPVIRLLYLIDGDGKTNTLSYNSTNAYSSNVVTKVTDPFMRSAYMAYNSNGNLTNLIDAVSNSTAINYDTNDWVTSMVTPYGRTSFSIIDNGTNQTAISRAVLITRPDSSRELYLNEDMAPGVTNAYPASALPNTSPFSNTFDNYALNFHDTFYWGPLQYQNLSTTNIASFDANDFLLADMKHWLAQYGNFNPSSSISFERAPSPDPGGTIEGQKTWYDYTGKSYNQWQGSWYQPSIIARVLPDTSSSINLYVRNPNGLIATNVSTYSVGSGVVGLRTNVYTYAANNIDELTSINALNVCVSSNWFNAYHEVVTNVDALNQKTLYIYNANQQLGETIYPNGLIITNIYGVNDLLASTIVLGFQTNSYTYANNLVVTSVDSRGLNISYSYDSLNRLTGMTYPDGSTVSNIYTVLDLTASKDRQGNWTKYGFDSMERMTSTTNALGNVTMYNYCICGSLESIIDAQTNVTTFLYDNEGNRTNITYADNYSVVYTYNLLRQEVVNCDSSGNSVTNVYNNQGRLVSTANAAGLLVSNIYDALDRITNSQDANGVDVASTFDNLNRVLNKTYPDTGVESFGYTINYPGATSYTNQITNMVLYAYDLLNRKTNEVFVGVSTNNYVFDGPGDLLKLIDGKSNTTTWQYDIYGQVTNKLDATGTSILSYQYDSDNRLTNRWSLAKGNTAYAYDGIGNLTNISYPASHGIQYAYDSLNRLTTMNDSVGTTTYAYDGVGQVLAESGLWPNGTVNYSYANRLRTEMSIQAPNASTWIQTYGYDASRRLNSTTSPVGTFNYIYDPSKLMLVDQLNLPGGSYITNQFDTVARQTLAAMYNTQGTNLDSYSYVYNNAGQRTQVTRAYGDYVNYTYDNEGELLVATGKAAGGSANRWQEQLGYLYDAAGNLMHRTNNTLLQSFAVNNLNEFTTDNSTGQLTVAGSTTSPATNVTVNLLGAAIYSDRTFAGTNQSWSNGGNTYTAIAKDVYGRSSTNSITVNLEATNNFTYDGNGNLLSDGIRNFRYDDENELTIVWVANSYSNNVIYDGKMRRRIEQDYSYNGSSWIETNEVHFIYDGNLVVQERNAGNIPLVTYTRGNDLSGTLQGAGGIGGLLARTDMGQWIGDSSFAHALYHTDGNGNVTCLCYENGRLAAKYLYDSFGNALGQYGLLADVNNYRFSSKEWNASSGLYYYGRRFYDPNLQRWPNRDPLGELGFKNVVVRKGIRRFGIFREFAEQLEGPNLYSFVANDPIGDIDLMGLTDFNCLQTQQQLAQAYSQAVAGPVQGLQNIYNNSSGRGNDDYAYNGQANDTWCVNGHKMNADHMANFMVGFQTQAYDNMYPVGNSALNIAGIAGVWYHITGQTKAQNDPWDNTGYPDINAGAEAANNWPSTLSSPISCCKSCN